MQRKANVVKSLPHNATVEAAVLGIALMRGSIAECGDLRADDFWTPALRAIWEAMHALASAGQAFDSISVHEQLRSTDTLRLAGGLDVLNRLGDRGASGYHLLAEHVRELQELAAQRQVIAAAQEVVELGLRGDHEDFVGFAEATMLRATQARAVSRIVGPELRARSFFERVTRRCKGQEPFVPTPWPDLNRLLSNGLHPGQLVILAGRPAMGKTAAALDIARRAATPSARDLALPSPPVLQPTLVFSLEMSSEEVGDREFAAEASVHGDAIRVGRIVADDFERLAASAGRIVKGRLFVDDSSAPTICDIVSRARRFRADRTIFTGEPSQIGLIVVDHLGLIAPDPTRKYQTREQEVADISRRLKALAKDLRMPVLAVSQLNRLVDNRSNKRPVLGDLRESGALEQDANVVMFMFREEYYLEPDATEKERERLAGIAECIVAKQRSGAVGTVKLRFCKQLTRFDALERYTP